MKSLTPLFLIGALAGAPALRAQDHSDVRLDLSMGMSTVSGGTIDFRTGILVDILGAAHLRQTGNGTLVGALGASGIMGGFGDRCLILPEGGCAGKGNFTVVTALIGLDRALDGGSVRLLAGPSYHSGANDNSVGLQGRIDVTSPTAGYVSLGAMARATLLPDHAGSTLVIWGAGVALAFR